jgi:hypothetical protein
MGQENKWKSRVVQYLALMVGLREGILLPLMFVDGFRYSYGKNV